MAKKKEKPKLILFDTREVAVWSIQYDEAETKYLDHLFCQMEDDEITEDEYDELSGEVHPQAVLEWVRGGGINMFGENDICLEFDIYCSTDSVEDVWFPKW